MSLLWSISEYLRIQKARSLLPILKISQSPLGLSVIIYLNFLMALAHLLCGWLDVDWILVDVRLMASAPKFKEAHILFVTHFKKLFGY